MSPDQTTARVLAALARHGPMAAEDLWQKAGTCRVPTFNVIKRLVADGILKREVTGSTRPRTRVALARPGMDPAWSLAQYGLSRAQALGMRPDAAVTMREISDYYRRAAAILEESS